MDAWLGMHADSLQSRLSAPFRRKPAGLDALPWPVRREAVDPICVRLLRLLRDGCGDHGPGGLDPSANAAAIAEIGRRLSRIMTACLRGAPGASLQQAAAETAAEAATIDLLGKLPDIQASMFADAQAAYDGDPAAASIEEVLAGYPCLEAVTAYRIAHELHLMGMPLLPRIITEWAHARTGIDIHPGARIGSSFFIDHGTGVVIGETSEIGNGVRMYHGVTLGALSFPKDVDGKLLKGSKRHPTIEDDVTLYASVAVLGGGTVIGRGSVIGGNSWIASSIPPRSRIPANYRSPIRAANPVLQTAP